MRMRKLSKRTSFTRVLFRLVCFLPVLIVPAGCKSPSVRIATDEPLQVDINMRIDVYQHSRDDNGTPGGASTAPPAQEKSTPESRRRNRMADIQEFKNSRIIGEGAEGLLIVIEEPPGDFGRFVVQTINEENADRMQVMRNVAERTKRPLPDVQAEQAAEWRRRSFSGEWIQLPAADGKPARWQQKSGDNAS